MSLIIAGSPLLALTLGTTLLLLLVALRRDVGLLRAAALLVLALTVIASVGALLVSGAPTVLTTLLQADRLAAGATLLLCVLASACMLMPAHTALRGEDQPEEYYLLLVIATLGGCVLCYADHLASLLLGLEIMAVALYALVSYCAATRQPVEAAIKYLVLSSAASATMLLGFALLYAATGALEFGTIGARLAAVPATNALAVPASLLILAGFAVKLAIVPFHLWTADVYEGAPTPVTAFLATVAKAAAVLALLRLLIEARLVMLPGVSDALALLAFITVLAGNWLALLQENLKRLLAFSSIAHAGYLLVALACMEGRPLPAVAQNAAVFYLGGYVVATAAAFAVVARLRHGDADRSLRPPSHVLAGLFWRSPLAALAMLLALLSLAGIPLTAGFVGKLYLFTAAAEAERGALLAVLVLGSAIGLYYYLRLVFAMTRRDADADADLVAPDRAFRVTTVSAMGLILGLGLLPAPFMAFLREALARL